VSQAHLNIVESFAVSPEKLWAAINDHEGMSEWTGARVNIIAGDGGVGTVRRVRARGLAIDEEVTYLDPPRRMVYRIVGGVPLLRFHRGEMLVEPWGKTGAELTWDIVLDSAVPGFAKLLAAILGPALRDGLSKLRSQLTA
jgi:uncharacterized protein YndB with AHSA1/START domain